MKITKRQLRRVIKEATHLMTEQYEEWEVEYPDEVAEHGRIVSAYYPGGNISKMVLEFEDGYEVIQGDPDEPDRFDRPGYGGRSRYSGRW